MPVAPVLERGGLPILFGAMLIFFSLYSSTAVSFRSAANLQNIFANQSVTGLIALGMIVPLVAGYFDLAVPAIAGLSSIAFASASGNHHLPIVVGAIIGIVCALIAGAFNAALAALLRLNPFVTTLGMYIMLGGLLEWYTAGATLGEIGRASCRERV